MKKEIIENNFTRHSELYDQHSDVQKHIASLLLEQLNGDSPKSILDIGCGTGWYTKRLSEKYPNSVIQAIDISPNMIEYAKKIRNIENINFTVGDAEKVEFTEDFDLITSNATLHWFSDFPSALFKFSELLTSEGIFLCSVFGPNTYSELSTVIKTFLGEENNITSHTFMNKLDVFENMKESFSNVTVDHIIYKEDHTSLLKLLQKIKYTGTRGMGISKALVLSRGKLAEMEKIYIDMFGKIVATNEVFICRGNSLNG